MDVVKLLLQWKADVTFRAADGRNSLDFAIDFSQKDCVLALIKHETWKLSMRNAVINPVSGLLLLKLLFLKFYKITYSATWFNSIRETFIFIHNLNASLTAYLDKFDQVQYVCLHEFTCVVDTALQKSK